MLPSAALAVDALTAPSPRVGLAELGTSGVVLDPEPQWAAGAAPVLPIGKLRAARAHDHGGLFLEGRGYDSYTGVTIDDYCTVVGGPSPPPAHRLRRVFRLRCLSLGRRLRLLRRQHHRQHHRQRLRLLLRPRRRHLPPRTRPVFLVPADYSGDGERTSRRTGRPMGVGTFAGRSVLLRRAERRSRAADYSGHQRADIAMYRRSTGTWYIKGAAAVPCGDEDDIPIPADYNGDG